MWRLEWKQVWVSDKVFESNRKFFQTFLIARGMVTLPHVVWVLGTEMSSMTNSMEYNTLW